MRAITGEQKEKLIAINALVKNEEVKAVERYQILEKELKQMIQKKSIWDYNLDFSLGCFTSDENLNKKYETEEGDPIYEVSIIYENIIDREPSWHEVHYFRKTILEDFRFCYTFYCVLYYSSLTLEDILLIDSIWIDISVDYQWEVNLEKV